MAKCCALFTGPRIFGRLNLSQIAEDEPTIIIGTLKGLQPGDHGISIHCFGDQDNVGPIFNPFRKPHGPPDSTERKVGNLGNISVISSKCANTEKMESTHVHLSDKLVKLIGPFSVIGRSIVIYEGEDDFGLGDKGLSLYDGNCGAKLGVAVIGISTLIGEDE